ncbi:hypothetical protein H0H92_003465, partial [Tricholoma furcatifolium]
MLSPLANANEQGTTVLVVKNWIPKKEHPKKKKSTRLKAVLELSDSGEEDLVQENESGEQSSEDE